MKVTVTTLSDDIFVLDVSEDLELENFKTFCEIESGFPAPEIVIVHEGRPLVDNKKSMKLHGIKDGDVVILQHMAHQGSQMSFNAPDRGFLHNLDFSSIQVPSVGLGGGGGGAALPPAPPPLAAVPTGGGGGLPGGGGDALTGPSNPAHIRDLILRNPDQLALLKQNNPRLADALANGLEDFSRVYREQLAEQERRRSARVRMFQADPLNTEAQRLIAEEIRRENIEANMAAAMEYQPESFGTVYMLYINCKVNGYPLKAFIDSGAQTTIMSAACAERINIMRLVDTRWSGYAKGVGEERIIGRVHMVQMAIESDYLTTSFTVLEEQPLDVLLGLDMLMRHQCCIDLKRNVLVIGTTGTETRFLSESELPPCSKLTITGEKLRQGSTSKSGDGATGGPSSNTSPGSTNSISRDPSLNILSTDQFTENEVKELVSFGFTREQVIAELRRFNGDKNQATAALFAKSLKF